MRPEGWAILREPPPEVPVVAWWQGRAAQVRRAIDSLDHAHAVRCACREWRPDYRGRRVYCDAPAGFPHRFGEGLFLTPPDVPRRPTLASLGLVPAATIAQGLGARSALRGAR